MNIIDPNALAWKGTKGPWLVNKHPSLRHGGFNNHRTVIYKLLDNHGPYQAVADVFGDSEEQCKANAYMAVAAPEAVEFIADLMPELDLMKASGLFDAVVVEKLISRAEEILKKAYNH